MKPLSLSRPMVRARRAGLKTKTRRLMNPQPAGFADWVKCDLNNVWRAGTRAGEAPHMGAWKCPFGVPGDQLWVREDFQIKTIYAHAASPSPFVGRGERDGVRGVPSRDVVVRYLADGAEETVTLTEHEQALLSARKHPVAKTPGRFMYQSLARDRPTLLTILVERLQDITEEDAWAEGCERGEPTDNGGWFPKEQVHPDGTMTGWDSAKDWFQDLWSVLHGPESWEANPWVWVLTLSPFVKP